RKPSILLKGHSRLRGASYNIVNFLFKYHSTKSLPIAMVLIQFDTEFQWRRFLQLYDPADATVKELSECKRYFMSGMEQMMNLLLLDLKKLDDDELGRFLLLKLMEQFRNYWKEEEENEERKIALGK
ncbi:MAG: hypothetical protein ABUT20_41445, partial [Bacteroidota bacterium]